MLQPAIVKVEPVRDNALILLYETGERKKFDVSPYIKGSWFGKLADFSYFSTVHLLPNGSGIEWADGQDIAPHELYENSEEIPDTPNAETLAAFAESEEMLKHPEKYKRYSSFSEALDNVLKDE